MSTELIATNTEQTVREQQISHGSVAFLDILGFKGMWQSIRPDILAGQIGFVSKLVEDVQRLIIKDMAKATSVDIDPAFININLISDTFLIRVEHEDPSIALFLTTQITADLISQMALFNFFKLDELPYAKPIFLRGAISHGWFYRKEKMFIGEAIDDAAEWFNQPEFIGAILTPRTGYFRQSNEINIRSADPGNLLCKYSAPTKNGNVELLCVDWIKWAKRSPKIIDISKAISLAFSNHGNIAPAHLIKYHNTKKFVDFCLETQDKSD